jgi:Flp pilus assembly pilin Flp
LKAKVAWFNTDIVLWESSTLMIGFCPFPLLSGMRRAQSGLFQRACPSCLPYYPDNTLEKIGVVLFDRRCAMQCAAYAFWSGEEGQDIAEYAVMLAVILVIVIGTIRLIGGNANNVFSSVASSLQ